ncbi:MAG: hypothetical protein ABI162_18995 [Luteolibacter sp.]
MKLDQSLIAAALAGLFAAGTVSANPTFQVEGVTAAEKEKDSCKGKDGCSGKDKEKKEGTFSNEEKSKDKDSCKGKDGCSGKDKEKKADSIL